MEFISYRKNQAEYDDILNHLTACSHLFVPPLDERVNINTYAERIFENADTFEAWSGNALIGLVAVYCNDESGNAFITNVSVLQEFNGRGIASAILKMCFHHLRRVSIRNVTLKVDGKNKPARFLYVKHNFQEIESYGDEIFMRRRI